MGVFDQAARFAATANPEAVVQRVLHETRQRYAFREWFDTRALALPGDRDRTADLVAILDDPCHPDQPWLLVFEFESRENVDKLGVTLEEAVLLHRNVRHGEERTGQYKVMTALVYLRGRCPGHILDMTMAGGFGTRHVPLLWEVAKENAGTVLEEVATEQVSWGMLFWIPLMAGGGEPAIVQRWRDIADTVVRDTRTRSNLTGIALVFATLSGCFLNWERGVETAMLKTESEIVNRWLDMGREEQQFTSTRQHIIRAIKRFGEQIPQEVIEVVNTQPSLAMLEDWFDAAVAVKSLAEFIAVLRR